MVKDSKNQKPISDVNIYLKKSRTGTTSDENGEFVLYIKNDKDELEIEFSHVAYESVFIYGWNKDFIEIEMNEVFLQLDDIVVTSMKCEYNLSNVPIYTEIINKSAIRQSGAVTLNDLMEQTPGISKNYDVHGSFDYNLLGLDSKYILILKDGNPITGKFNDKVDLDQIMVLNTDRIEIIKGPGSALYGTEAMGGVINIISDKSIKKNKVEVQLRKISYEDDIKKFQNGSSGDVLSLTYGKSYKAFEFQSSILSQRLRKNGSNNDLGKDKIDKLNIDGQLGWESSNEKNEVNIRFIYFDQLDGAKELTSTGYLVSSNSTNIDRKDIKVDYKKIINKNVTFFQNISSSHYSREYNQSGIDSTFFRLNMAKESLIDYEAKINFNTSVYNWIAGFEYSEPGYNNMRLRDTTHRRTLKGLFLQNQYMMSEKINLVTGFRSDIYNKKIVYNPRIALMFNFNTKIKYRLSYGEGFRVPSILETFIDFYNIDQGYMVKGNPNLKPEKSKGLTFNLDFSGNNRFRLNFLGYYNIFTNKISTEQQTNAAVSSTTFSYQNISEATFKGFEIFSDFILDNTSTIRLNLNLRESNDENGMELPRTIPVSTGINYTQNIQRYRLRLILNYSYNRRTKSVSSFEILDLRLNKKISKNFSLNIGIKNIGNFTDSEYGPYIGRSTYIEMTKQ
tara:strand:+ start:579 stop:2606 length:2028 start_codon:yes stop_codon:yes gene_type:complete